MQKNLKNKEREILTYTATIAYLKK